MTGIRPLAAITGASSGIGETFARKLAARGYDLLLIARRRDRLEALAAEIEKYHSVQAEPFTADLTSDSDLLTVEQRLSAAENLDLLVNNAGFGTLGGFFEAPLDAQDKMHRLHVIATMRLCHTALRGMVARANGSIINVSSVAGFMQAPGNASYCSTKCWMNSFTEGLYLDLKSAGLPVRVQALCPGYTYSEFHDTLGTDRGAVPKSFWTQSEFVVEESLRGLSQRKLFVIPGWRYKALVRFLDALPRSLKTAMASRRAVRQSAR